MKSKEDRILDRFGFAFFGMVILVIIVLIFY